MRLRHAHERGRANQGWLRSHHTFSFASYVDPRHMGFRSLRVINEDRVTGGAGFGTHPHQDMEIISYVLSGTMAHQDSMDNGSTMRPGDVQRMSAGTGVLHSEFNASPSEELHFLQIWIEPRERGIAPSYEQRSFPPEDRQGRWRLVVSPQGLDDSVSVNQDVNLYAGLFDAGESAETPATRHAWLHVAKGEVAVNGQLMSAGDAAAFEPGEEVRVVGIAAAEVLLFDLA
ncbi:MULTISPECIES: pirin family protein [Halomonas]|uniref:pirin family protein n=1 Tax=Halomonas TaxID=2745 RepID=UPI001C98B7D2|nr:MULTISPECIES: pirin family protein [Halomonas]MBY6208674.1 pirin family protein [Halomonas sp. DP3Y7-2]MBY6227145.1 pirin family protein [Halomonas sp. DP3Y7-1]MCA0915106.1 pirin family protein [Halomonas denitrificans]